MHKVTEMLCMFCLRSVTTTSPVCEKDDTVKEHITISRCRHLMHMSCFVHAVPADPVTCRHPKCGKIIDCNQVDVIEANLKDRIVETLDEKRKLVDELTTRLNLATSNLDLSTRLKGAEDKIAELEANSKEAEKRTSEAKAAELDAKKRYDAAEEKMAQLESNVKHYSELVVDANKRASEAKAAELDVKKRYELVVGKLSNQPINCTCIASDSSVLVSKDCKGVPLLLPNELSPPGLTSPIVPISGSNNVNNALVIDQNQQVFRVKKTNKECLLTESIADFPNASASADFTPISPPDSNDTFLPFSESIEGPVPKGTIDMSMKSSLQHVFQMDFLKDKQLTEDDISREIETIPIERVAAEEKEKNKTDDHVLQQETGDKVFQDRRGLGQKGLPGNHEN